MLIVARACSKKNACRFVDLAIQAAETSMQAFPHTYIAAASGSSSGTVMVTSPLLPALQTAAPPQFDGPGGMWSPEALLCAAVADCFVLTFRAVARAARFGWLQLECQVTGVLESVERKAQFTRYTTFATLTVPAGANSVKAQELLATAEEGCLVANSLRGARSLQTRIVYPEPVQRAPAA
jgi:organic hydroperoxide reductase OsmC/OhrA